MARSLFQEPNTASTAANNYATGRLSPNFTNQITAAQLNAFLKYKGLEFFGYSPEKSATGVAESRMIKKHILTKPEWEYKRFRGHGDNPTWGFQRKRGMRW